MYLGLRFMENRMYGERSPMPGLEPEMPPRMERMRDSGQPDEDQNEQQQQQPANHSPDNAEIVRCLTPFPHPERCFGRAKYEQDNMQYLAVSRI